MLLATSFVSDKVWRKVFICDGADGLKAHIEKGSLTFVVNTVRRQNDEKTFRQGHTFLSTSHYISQSDRCCSKKECVYQIAPDFYCAEMHKDGTHVYNTLVLLRKYLQMKFECLCFTAATRLYCTHATMFCLPRSKLKKQGTRFGDNTGRGCIGH